LREDQQVLKKLSGEFTQRSDKEADKDARLYELARARHREGGFGSHWNHHSTVFMKRQVLSRLL
jgi:hypothetical protein